MRLLRTLIAVAVVGSIGACGSSSGVSDSAVAPTTTSPQRVTPLSTGSNPSASEPAEIGEDTLLLAPESARGCVTTPGALQEVLDSVPDGSDVFDMKGKLIDAEQLGFSVLDLSDMCFENQGSVQLDGRYGLWLVRPTTMGTDWLVTNTFDTVLSGFDFGEANLTIEGGNLRVEAGAMGSLSIKDATDFMMGKVTVSGHATFDSMTRVDSDKSFARNSTFATVEVTGMIDGFKIETSSADSYVDTTSESARLNVELEAS